MSDYGFISGNYSTNRNTYSVVKSGSSSLGTVEVDYSDFPFTEYKFMAYPSGDNSLGSDAIVNIIDDPSNQSVLFKINDDKGGFLSDERDVYYESHLKFMAGAGEQVSSVYHEGTEDPTYYMAKQFSQSPLESKLYLGRKMKEDIRYFDYMVDFFKGLICSVAKSGLDTGRTDLETIIDNVYQKNNSQYSDYLDSFWRSGTCPADSFNGAYNGKWYFTKAVKSMKDNGISKDDVKIFQDQCWEIIKEFNDDTTSFRPAAGWADRISSSLHQIFKDWNPGYGDNGWYSTWGVSSSNVAKIHKNHLAVQFVKDLNLFTSSNKGELRDYWTLGMHPRYHGYSRPENKIYYMVMGR